MSELIERGLRCPYRCTETTLDWDVTDSFIVESVLPEAKVFDGVTISTYVNAIGHTPFAYVIWPVLGAIMNAKWWLLAFVPTLRASRRTSIIS